MGESSFANSSVATLRNGPFDPYDGTRMSTGPAIVERPQHRRKIRLPEVLRRTGLSRSTLYELMENDIFPAQAKAHGTRTAMWWEDEVDDWNESPANVSPQKFGGGSLPDCRPKEVFAGSEEDRRPPLLHAATPRKHDNGKESSTKMSGLKKTGMTILGREVYRHIASNRLLLDVGVSLPEPLACSDAEETTSIQ